jgi:uncharacterized membrane protein
MKVWNMDQFLSGSLYWTTLALEVAGICTIVLGICLAGVRVLLQGAREGRPGLRFREFRSRIGRAILLGLEFLVAADIINTVAIEPTIESVAVLAGIVAIRTFLSFALEVEIEGQWPWRRGAAANRQMAGTG